MPRAVLLLVNRDKPEVVGALPAVRALIARHGRLVAELDACNSPLASSDVAGVEMVIVLGGDGTLMAQSRRCVGLGLPMLGVNLGKLGFMAEFDLDSLTDQAREVFGGAPLRVQSRPMLHVNVYSRSGALVSGQTETLSPNAGDPTDAASSLALNDAVIAAGPPYRMIAMTMRIDEQPGPEVMGDGLVISTPIGSTAYNVSAGGPIVSPEVSAMTITPLAAHSLSFRPVVVPSTSTIEVRLDRVNDMPALGGIHGGTSLVLDGQLSVRLHAGDRVVVRQNAHHVQFVQNPRGNYWATLISKMRWAAQTGPSRSS